MEKNKIYEAIEFATIAHDRVYRKGTNIPYITHVMEAALIASSLTDDEDVIVAAMLHDVVEDTNFSVADIKQKFGPRVAKLVSSESEDKMEAYPAELTWRKRKEYSIEKLKSATKEEKIICLADKLSNMRLSEKTFAKKGDDMWLVFNQKDKSEQEWYYRSIYKNMQELKDTEAYEEYVQLCDQVFGKEESASDFIIQYDPFVYEDDKDDSLLDFVKSEIVKIDDFYLRTTIQETLTKPLIFLSDKELYDYYGKRSDEETAKLLEKYVGAMKKVYFYENIITTINKIIIELKNKDSQNDATKYGEDLADLERAIILEGNDEEKKILNDILEILSQRKLPRQIRLGQYLPERHQIVIYFKAIKKECSRNSQYLEKISMVLAHEYLHAMHCARNPEHPIWNSYNIENMRTYQKKEIKEALADFFSVYWCYRNEYYDVTIERFEKWKKLLFTSWPYAKALYLLKDYDKRIPSEYTRHDLYQGANFMKYILLISDYNPKKAYEELKG